MKIPAAMLLLALAGLVSTGSALVTASAKGAKGTSKVATVTKDRTITKVVKMLEDLMAKSKEDGDKDRKIYAKFLCYCNTKKETKTKEIEELTKVIALLEDEIAKLKGSNGVTSVELAKIKADKAANREAVDKATKIREDEKEAFEKFEEDMLAANASLAEAISTLAEVGADQTMATGADHDQFMAGFEGASLLKLKAKVRAALVTATAFLKPKQKQTVQSFLQAPFTGTYTSQSGEVVGILKQMKDTFEANLASARATEAAAQKAFDAFIEIKEKEYAELERLQAEKETLMADNDASLATARESLKTAQDDKAIREEFLEELIPLCSKKAEEYEQRQQLRANEDAAVAEAIAILNKDAAFETFGKVEATSAGASFLQLRSARRHAQGGASVRKQVQELLQQAAKKHKSLRLVKIVALLEAGNPFTAVLEAIDKLVAIIEKEGEADKENLDWCNSERETSDARIEELSDQITSLEETIAGLIEAIEAPETGLKDRIAATELALKENYDDQVTQTAQRTEANQAYQANIADIVEAEGLLDAAIHVLTKYYEGEYVEYDAEVKGTKVLAGEEEAHPETEEGYKGQGETGKKAIDMLTFILDNTKKEETAAHTMEHEAQHAYEDSMQELKDTEASLQETLADLKMELAEKEKALAEAKDELKKTVEEKESIEAYLLKIKPGCDFITENIDYRKERQTSEISALKEAKDLLKDTPVYKAAVAEAHLTSMGDCRDKCVEHGEEHVICKACLAKVEIPGYCAGHEGTEGCD
jgi:hypothetical protein